MSLRDGGWIHDATLPWPRTHSARQRDCPGIKNRQDQWTTLASDPVWLSLKRQHDLSRSQQATTTGSRRSGVQSVDVPVALGHGVLLLHYPLEPTTTPRPPGALHRHQPRNPGADPEIRIPLQVTNPGASGAPSHVKYPRPGRLL